MEGRVMNLCDFGPTLYHFPLALQMTVTLDFQVKIFKKLFLKNLFIRDVSVQKS